MEHAHDPRQGKGARHERHMKAARIVLALLVALVASSVAGQSTQPRATGAAAPAQASPPPATGPSYGPVLHPQPLKSEPGAQPEQTPQAREEKAGAVAQPRRGEVDPSARPAPQPKDPAGSGAEKAGNGKSRDARRETGKAARKDARNSGPRRAVWQRIDPLPAVT
ncbi:hypothetical protein G4G28_07720 [Massilia sp. Dwa41.01b]|uniref:hypothetical protein n=1 Tax=Massilia sp. Dwa41.01b TaxID=2709302 RepID=UPI001600D40F|nr:hypothetical protein [Massilia sp. Dwa41.01b]QNA88412.1 hypothetical protein G4G28_07720 [Massilia sp. Dwa41.01b]